MISLVNLPADGYRTQTLPVHAKATVQSCLAEDSTLLKYNNWERRMPWSDIVANLADWAYDLTQGSLNRFRQVNNQFLQPLRESARGEAYVT